MTLRILFTKNPKYECCIKNLRNAYDVALTSEIVGVMFNLVQD